MQPQASRGATLAQKIIARAAGREHVRVGEYVDCTPDYLVNQELVWPNHKRNLDRLGIREFAIADRYIMVVDHTTSAAMGSPHHATHRLVKDVAEQYGVENFYGPGNGLRHLVMVEHGYARPGLLVFSDEGNICSVGAVGALSIPMSTDIVAVLARGQNWIPVPKSVRIELHGRLAFGVSARDFAQTLIRDFTTSGEFMDCCLEFGGPGLASLTMDDRQTILATIYHTGADTGLMEVDDVALAYVRARAKDRPFQVMRSDPDAQYAMVLRYDLTRIEPMVTVPPEIQAAVPLARAAGRRVDQATIGSCAGNRLQDLRDAATILKGRKIARHVTMYVSPGSANVFADAAREGLLEVFAESGATVLQPGCNTCWGYHGVMTGKEVSITTHQFNYAGRNGSQEAEIFIGSPLTVAASAVAGRITDPRSFLGGDASTAAATAGEPAYVVERRTAPGPITADAGAPAVAGPTNLRGKVWKFGDEVSGDAGIIDFSAVRDGFGKPFDEPLLKSMCFRKLNPDFPQQVRPGDIVVGGTNFAHQNHVEVSAAIKLSGIAAVVVESCESAFVRRALSQGLPVLVVPGISQAVAQDDVIEVDPATGIVRTAGGTVLRARPFSARMVAIWQAGGLIPSLQMEAPARPQAAVPA
ncbi:MAG TPA: aconitase family protein [Ramlibacter sp.]|nr:aconitase family protein [Ramlibacter sp.]